MSDGNTRSKPISRRLRFEILRRDGQTCRYCGATAPDAKLTVDHVVPRALGGNDAPDNLVAACVDCNNGKTSVAPDQSTVVDVAESNFRWAAAMAQAGKESRQQRGPGTNDLALQFDPIWLSWSAYGEPLPRPGNWANPLMTWVRNGLTMDDLRHYVGVAMKNAQVHNSNKWRYFCGCCWGELRRREERATELLAATADAEIEPWAVTPEGVKLYVDPLCVGCGGNGYVESGPMAWELEECWCLTQYPHTNARH